MLLARLNNHVLPNQTHRIRATNLVYSFASGTAARGESRYLAVKPENSSSIMQSICDPFDILDNITFSFNVEGLICADAPAVMLVTDLRFCFLRAIGMNYSSTRLIAQFTRMAIGKPGPVVVSSIPGLVLTSRFRFASIPVPQLSPRIPGRFSNLSTLVEGPSGFRARCFFCRRWSCRSSRGIPLDRSNHDD